MKKTIRNSLVVYFLCTVIACANPQVKTDPPASTNENQDAVHLLGIINNINNNSPATFSASFEADGNMRTQQFKLSGTAFYDKNSEKLLMNFSDFIFKSQISSLLRNGNNIEVFYIPENRIVLDSVETIRVSNYVPINMDFYLVYQLLTARIPILENHSVYQVTKDGNKSFLVLENTGWYQTIAFNSDEPAQIKFTNKSNSQEIEIYLRSPLNQNGSKYYRKIQFRVRGAGITVNINTGWVRMNTPVNIRNSLINPGAAVTNLRRR